MSCFSATVTTANVAEPNPTKHVNYVQGMVLGVADFTQAHAYLSGRDQWMIRCSRVHTRSAPCLRPPRAA